MAQRQGGVQVATIATALVATALAACTPASATNHASPAPSARSASPARSATPVATKPYCPGFVRGHQLVVAWLTADNSTTVFVRDVQDPTRAINLCELPEGVPRFVSATEVAIWNLGYIYKLDLETGVRSNLLNYSHEDGPVLTTDWSPTGLFAYGRLTPDMKSIDFHLVSGASDRVLATIAGDSLGVGSTRVEFSPNGEYLAIGAPGHVSSGKAASVQVRRSDGTLVFTSGGDGQLTWAGETPRLYFESTSGVKTWDAVGGVKRLAVSSWNFPSRSADGRWLTYEGPGYPSEVRLIDTRSGQNRKVGLSERQAQWITSSRFRFDRIVSCSRPTPGAENYPCSFSSTIYDVIAGTFRDSDISYVFATWPKGTPTWF